MHLFTRRSLLVFLISAAILGGATGMRADDPLASPESVGFSSAGLKTFQQTMRGLVDDGKLAGVTTLVARHGKVVHFDAYGVQDLESKKPVTKDTIFRIASMTKPIVGVAMMMLWEEGKWTLDDPVSKHIPQFAGLKVKTPNGEVAQTRPMTMRQLMSHTAGFGTSGSYEGQNITDRTQPLQAMIDKLAKLPLASQPGTDWAYGPSVDIQGYVVEKLSGQSLDVFLRTRIFEPLGMKDTGFWVDESKRDRVTNVHTYSPDKKIMTAPTQSDPTRKPVFLSGGGGLLSTTEDYFRFTQMLLNGGEANGKRLIKKSTVELMRTNVLEEGVARRPLRSQLDPGRRRLRPGLRDRDGPGEGESPRRQELVLLGRRVRHVVLDRSDQRSGRHRHDAEPQWQHADRRLAAGAAAVAKAGLRGARRPTEVG